MPRTATGGAVASRVLVVDDDPLLHSAVARTLGQAGMAGLHVHNADEALQRLSTEDVDVVLTDYDMPGLNGLQLIQRACSDCPGAPVFVLMTGLDSVDFAASGPEAEVFSILRKPVDSDELLATLAAARQLRERRCQQGRASILLLEDDADDADLFKVYVRRMDFDIDLQHCTTLTAALDMARRRTFDLAVVDMNTADSQGLDAVRKLRAAAPSMALVILTHSSDDALAEQALAMGAQEFLVKHSSPPRVLEHALRRAHARKQSERHLVHVATHDALTNLVNGHVFRAILRHRVERARESGTSMALLYIDLDGFKRLNDSYGHAAGDAVLRHVAECLTELTREGDTAARVGGDEFVLMLDDASDASSVRHVAQRLIRAIERPIELPDGTREGVSASVGVALCPQMSTDPEELLQLADQGMYLAKGSGGKRVRSPRSGEARLPRADVEDTLRIAVERHSLAVALQPQVPLASSRRLTFEALLRWPARPEIGPREFVPWLDDLSLLGEVTDWVVACACLRVRELRAERTAARVGVNMPPRLVRSDQRHARLAALLQAHAVRGDDLEIEVSDTRLPLDDHEFVNGLRRLKEATGVRLVIDNFGAGAASLTALRSCGFDVVKIDPSYVRSLPFDACARGFVEGIRAYTRRLGVEMVAEGVETEEQLQAVREAGFDAVQGFLVGKPAPLELAEAEASVGPRGGCPCP